jgi:TrmH family RNA methyltransferase
VGRRSARVEEDRFVVEGEDLVRLALAAGFDVEAVYVESGFEPTSPLGAPVFELGPGVMERVASTRTPQPVLAVVGRRLAPVSLLGSADFVVVGDRITDPGNAGTMLRSAEAAGADAVVLTSGSVDVFNPKAVRASAGALFTVPVVADVDLAEALAACPGRSWGASSHTGVPYTSVDFISSTVLVVGNEAHGLAPDAPVDGWVTIPHAGRAESLNVAMATTLLVFEVARQRAAR